MSMWAWVQPGYRIWKVITDYREGSIRVYNENGEILLEKRGLRREVISIIEARFFDVVATRLPEHNSDNTFQPISGKPMDFDNPMYI